MIYKKSWKYILHARYNRDTYIIKAVKNFGNVSKGKLGGSVMNYHNLSQKGNCWIYDEASVVDNARVTGNAKVCDYALINGSAVISDNAQISGYAGIGGSIIVYGNKIITEGVYIYKLD
jgi:UDP-3-O-[3-hydroxymyristoyl] glucosamine N-acyltransferase